jgi:DNA repair exonuclease SbcCD nuclease subunit
LAKIAIIADTHWGIRNDSSVFYDYFQKSLEFFYDTIEKEEIEYVIHMGDLFDRRKYLNFLTAQRCRTDFLEPLNKLVKEIHIIAGNHDEYYKNTDRINCLDEIVGSRYKHIHIHTNPKDIQIDGFNILLLPWINETNRDESFERINNSKSDVAFGHLEIQGHEFLKGITSTTGSRPDVFSRFDDVFSGHYHHRSSIGNIHYLGAFAEFTWSDYNDDRGFSVFDTDTREMTFYKNPLTMFRMFAYDDKVNPKIHEEDLSGLANSYVKVVVKHKTPATFDLFLNKLYDVSPIDITIVEDMNAFLDNDEFSEIDQAEDTPTILDKYIDGLTTTVDPVILKQFMRKVHTEAMSLENVG